MQEPIFADKMSSIQIIKRSQDTLDAAAETAIAKLTQENRGKPVTKAQEDEARLSILRESMANQLLVRLKLQSQRAAFVVKVEICVTMLV